MRDTKILAYFGTHVDRINYEESNLMYAYLISTRKYLSEVFK